MSIYTEEQYQSVLKVLAGQHNMAIVEKRKAPSTFAYLGNHGAILESNHALHVVLHFGAEGPEYMVVREREVLRAYDRLIWERPQYTRADFQRAIGTLLGYHAHQIEAFVADPPDCDCTKCGGPVETRLQRDARLARTQYHAK